MLDTALPGNRNTGHEFRKGYVPFDESKPPETQYQGGVIGPELTQGRALRDHRVPEGGPRRAADSRGPCAAGLLRAAPGEAGRRTTGRQRPHRDADGSEAAGRTSAGPRRSEDGHAEEPRHLLRRDEQPVRPREHERRPRDSGARPRSCTAASLLRPGRGHAARARRLDGAREEDLDGLRPGVRRRDLLEGAGGLQVPDGRVGAWRQGLRLRLQPRRVHGAAAGRGPARPRAAAARQREPDPVCAAPVQGRAAGQIGTGRRRHTSRSATSSGARSPGSCPRSRTIDASTCTFSGLWDTVSSVGWLWDPPVVSVHRDNPSVDVVWHAISINERRWLFRQNRLHQASKTQELHEQWFPGVHSDVGGGYPEADGGLWRTPFGWIVERGAGRRPARRSRTSARRAHADSAARGSVRGTEARVADGGVVAGGVPAQAAVPQRTSGAACPQSAAAGTAGSRKAR